MTTATYTVTGMTCGNCVNHVTEEVEGLPGVTAVAITLDDGRMEITSAAPLQLDAVKDAVAEAGDYTVTVA